MCKIDDSVMLEIDYDVTFLCNCCRGVSGGRDRVCGPIICWAAVDEAGFAEALEVSRVELIVSTHITKL